MSMETTTRMRSSEDSRAWVGTESFSFREPALERGCSGWYDAGDIPRFVEITAALAAA